MLADLAGENLGSTVCADVDEYQVVRSRLIRCLAYHRTDCGIVGDRVVAPFRGNIARDQRYEQVARHSIEFAGKFDDIVL
jgi:hypothetical protein